MERFKDIGVRVKYIRTRIGYTQMELAEQCGVHYSQISNIERETRTASEAVIAKIADVAGITVNDLLTGDLKRLKIRNMESRQYRGDRAYLNDYPGFRARLKLFRLDSGLSSEAFAEKVGICRNTVLFYENGKSTPSYESVRKIAAAFGMTPEELLAYDDEETKTAAELRHQANIGTGAKVRSLRKKQHLSIVDFAARIGISYNAVRRYENGGTTIPDEIMDRMIAVFNISKEDFEALNRCPDMPENTAAIGRRIKAARIKAGVSAPELARAIHIGAPLLYHYERGCARIPFYRVMHVAEALKVPLVYLVTGKTE